MGNMASLSSFTHPQCYILKSTNDKVAYHDNCCSYHATGDIDLIYDLKPLVPTIKLDGINGGVTLTHSCRFRCIPETNNLNSGYYAKGIITLISTGYLQRGGCTYKSSVASDTVKGIQLYLPNGDLFDNPKLSDNNLLPVSDTVLKRTCFSTNPTIRMNAYSFRHRSTPTLYRWPVELCPSYETRRNGTI